LAAEQYDKAVELANSRKTLGETDILTQRSKSAKEAAEQRKIDNE
jgi:hypothetical protein